MRAHPGPPALATVALALGSAAAATTLAIHLAMTHHPAPALEGTAYMVQIDPWGGPSPYTKAGEPPDMVTWRDGVALLQARAAARQVLSYPSKLSIVPSDNPKRAEVARTRFTSADFFDAFDTPWLFGSGWEMSDDGLDPGSAGRVVVLSKGANERLFDGHNSVGQAVDIAGEPATVVGVLDHWHPTPLYYDMSGPRFIAPEDIYLPIGIGLELQAFSAWSTNCDGRYPANFDDLLESECVWLTLWVHLLDAEDVVRYRAVLDEHVQHQATMGLLPLPANNRLRSVRALLDSQVTVTRGEQIRVLLALGFLALCLVNVAALMGSWTAHKSHLLGLHRALGARRIHLVGHALLEGTALGVVAALPSIVISAIGLWTLAQQQSLSALVTASTYTVGMLLAVITPVLCAALASAVPIFLACRVKPQSHGNWVTT